MMSNMNMLCWNVRGLGRGEKCIGIRKLISRCRASLVGLVETKHRHSFDRRVRRMWGSDDFDWCESLASETHSGGLLAIWNPNMFSVSHRIIGDRWIILEGCLLDGNFNCCVGITYGPNNREGRNSMYESLKEVLGSIGKPILLLGDFNEILHPQERQGQFRYEASMRDFVEWVEDLHFIDVPLLGIRFTWGRMESQSRIDRCLCNNEWFIRYPDMQLEGLKRSFSDHNPLLLSLKKKENWGPKPFRAYDSWFLNPEFKKFLCREWENLPNMGLHNKLKALKAPLKTWSKEKFAEIDNKIEKLEAVVHELQLVGENRPLNVLEGARLRTAQSHLHAWSIRRERVWRQKARTYGFSMKDHNTKFFHAYTIIKRKRNDIAQLEIDGNIVTGVKNLKLEIRKYMMQRFSQPYVPEVDFDMDGHSKVTADQVAFLEAMPSREEVKEAVWACGVDKAPGFDGFNFKFIREMWEQIKEEIYRFVIGFFEGTVDIRAINVTWVALIPKTASPTSIEDFRPISMVGALYKIISKLLSLRLKVVIAPLIDESQSAFVMDRQILDGVLVANEAIGWLRKKKIQGALLKLDFQKAYDSVRWSFLEKVMLKMGFGRKWVQLIMRCVSTASLSVLLNGSPLKPIKMERGLRQGDPLSPYLFILVSEVLVNLLRKADELKIIEGLEIGKDKVRLKHLQFADDTLIFVPKNNNVITNYFRILDVFAIMSGLNLNYSKSSFISWSTHDNEWAIEMANSVGCDHKICPVSYLGLPLGDNMSKCSAWKPVLAKIEGKLATWKTKILSRAGRLTLIKSVLNSLPVYFMSMFKIPKSVAQKIVKLQRRFFWGKTAAENRITPSVKWACIELPKSLGGLGVGNIMYKNLVLLFKWWWRFSGSDSTLWKRILISVHNIKGLKATSEAFGRIKSGTWAQLMRNETETKRIREIVENGLLCTVGDGKSTRFWLDKWVTGGSLKERFPRLFLISIQREATVHQMGTWVENEWVWGFKWRRQLFDWEIEDLERLKLLLQQIKPDNNKKDGVNWKGVDYHHFPIKLVLEQVYEDIPPTIPKPITALLWSIKVPPRVQLTIWMACLEKLPTGDLLVDKGVLVPSQASCPFCGEEIETNTHVLFTCKFSWCLWMRILNWWNISGVLPKQCSQFILAWRNLAPRRCRGKLWNLVLGCVLWSIWYERNRVKFNNGTVDGNGLLSTLKIRIGTWARELLGVEIQMANALSLGVVDPYNLS
jgi:reverse transcriptase-like protein/endonuclease/exonuclease/phosphatase family protein